MKLRFAFLFSFLSLAALAGPDFTDAEKAVDAQDWPRALKAFRNLESEIPSNEWPRADQHQLALSYFQSGDMEHATDVWGRMICENHGGAYAFRAAFNLALTQQRLGRGALAYIGLASLSGDLMQREPETSRRAYFQLAGALAEELGKKASAAAIYETAEASLRSATDRGFFRAHRRALGANPVDKRQANSGGDIKGLHVEPLSAASASETHQRLTLVGRYQEKGWTLYCGGMRIQPNEHGAFRLAIDVAGQNADTQFYAFGPKGEVQSNRQEFFAANWAHFRAPASVSELAAETSGESSEAKTEHEWALEFAPGFSISHLSFTQTGNEDLTSSAADVTIAARVSSPGEVWHATLRWTQQIKEFSATAESMFSEGDLDAGRHYRLSSGWSVDADLGIGIVSLYSSEQNTGFRNGHWLGLAPTLKWQTSEHDTLGLALRAGIFVDQPPVFSAARRMMTLGLDWRHAFKGWAIVPGLDLRLIHLDEVQPIDATDIGAGVTVEF